jgi:ribonuclease BN (tRNA processing enzyme)
MHLHVLGSAGGVMPDFRPSSFLLDRHILFDAGSICSVLPLADLFAIEHIFISHTHLDHIRDIGFLADILASQRQKAVQIYATVLVIDILKKHYFNNTIWPDFTQIPSREHPVIRLCEIQALIPVCIGEYEITPIPMNHTVETCGYLISNKQDSILYSADTGPTELFWEYANNTSNLRGIILDVAFPNAEHHIALLSKHLTPRLAAKELDKLKNADIPVYFFHLKPVFFRELLADLQPLLVDFPHRSILQSDRHIDFL